MKRDYIDFHSIPDHQVDIHNRLNNWASWCRVSPRAWSQHPLWKQYRSNWRQWHVPEYRPACDLLDALNIERHVRVLPRGHREAIRWYYVYGGNPLGMARQLGVTKDMLSKFVEDGRSMLKNRC